MLRSRPATGASCCRRRRVWLWLWYVVVAVAVLVLVLIVLVLVPCIVVVVVDGKDCPLFVSGDGRDRRRARVNVFES